VKLIPLFLAVLLSWSVTAADQKGTKPQATAKQKLKPPPPGAVSATPKLRSLELKGTVVRKQTTVKDEVKNAEITTTIYGLKTAAGATIRLPITKALEYAQFVDQNVTVSGEGYSSSTNGKKRVVLKRVSGVNTRDVEE
jgi:hypothetical protein